VGSSSYFDSFWALADETLADVFSSSITYYRGVNSVSLTAEAALRDHPVVDVDGIVTSVQARDFTVAAADLVISGSIILPRSGDRIYETIGATTHIWEVVPVGKRTCYEWADTQKATWLIHTKYVGTA
jgi:hypothetical protein